MMGAGERNAKVDLLRDDAVMLLMQAYVDDEVTQNEHWRIAAKATIDALQKHNDSGIERYWNDLAIANRGAEL